MTFDSCAGPVIVPRRDLDPVATKEDLLAALDATDAYKDANRALERMAANVYKDPRQVVTDIREAAITGKIDDRSVVKRLELDPESYGPYKGAGGVYSSMQERKEYRNAVAARSGLRGIADQMITTAHSIRQVVAAEKQHLAERGKVEIRMPDGGIMNAIEKKQPLSEAQSAEIGKAIRSFERRFGDDIGKVRTARNLDPVAQKHGLDPQQITMARQVLKTLDKGQSQARKQAQAIRQSQGQARGGPVR